MEDDVSDVASHHLRGRNLWVLRVRAEAGDGGHRQPALHVHLELDDGRGLHSSTSQLNLSRF